MHYIQILWYNLFAKQIKTLLQNFSFWSLIVHSIGILCEEDMISDFSVIDLFSTSTWGACFVFIQTNIMSKTLKQLIIDTLEKSDRALSVKEIWEYSDKLNTRGDFQTSGKTLVQSIASQISRSIKHEPENTPFEKIKINSSSYFQLKKFPKDISFLSAESKEITTEQSKSRFHERDLHPLLVAFADSKFDIYLKTIYHEQSFKLSEGKNEWLHPDIVGVYFPFEEYQSEVKSLQNNLSVNSIKLYSFELKIKATTYPFL